MSFQFWIILSGILLRLKHLAENRPFWLDESYVAVNITSRSFSEILTSHEILPEFARQPTIFSLIEKALVNVFGNTELVLRLFPFACGLGAFLAFAFIGRRFLSQQAYMISLSFFALAEPLVYYSAELKQYSTDLLCAVLLIAGAGLFIEKNFKLSHGIMLAISGAVALWLSNAMIFVLAGIGLVILLNKPWGKGARVISLLIVTALLWVGSFALLYFVSLRFMIGRSSITDTWQGAFCTSPIFSLATLSWAWNVFSLSFPNPIGLKWWGLMIPFFTIGVLTLWKKNKNDALLWLLPIVVTFLAALFGKYPFYGRVLLFLTAGYYVFIASGIDAVLNFLSRFNTKWVLPLVLLAVFAQPTAEAGYYLFHSRSKTDNRAAMEFLAEYYKPGDYLYLSTLAQEPFWYYAATTGLSKNIPLPVVGIADNELLRGMKISKFALDPKKINGKECLFFRSEYIIFNDARMFRASMGSPKDNQNVTLVPLNEPYQYPPTGRTWLFVSGPSALEAGVNAQILGSFDKKGKRLLTYEGLNAGAYLFDLR